MKGWNLVSNQEDNASDKSDDENLDVLLNQSNSSSEFAELVHEIKDTIDVLNDDRNTNQEYATDFASLQSKMNESNSNKQDDINKTKFVFGLLVKTFIGLVVILFVKSLIEEWIQSIVKSIVQSILEENRSCYNQDQQNMTHILSNLVTKNHMLLTRIEQKLHDNCCISGNSLFSIWRNFLLIFLEPLLLFS